MTTLTPAPTDEAVTAAAARHDLVVGLTDSAIWWETHAGAELPEGCVNSKRVRGDDRDEKIAHLRAIAASWDVPVETLPDGTMIARRTFGPVIFEAHLAPHYSTMDAYLDGAKKARRARDAGTGAAA
jgi:hypothetical protein